MTARQQPREPLARIILLSAALAVSLLHGGESVADGGGPQATREIGGLPDRVLRLISREAASRKLAAEELEANWDDRAIPMLIELLRFIRNEPTTNRAIDMLQTHTGERYGSDIAKWQHWLWNRDPLPAGALAEFKSLLYRLVDPRFGQYFAAQRVASIRLDEVVWGGVAQDGIPPLRAPKMIDAAEADYLADGDIVFAVSIEGDLRAYPKRIIGWHEMFIDTVGGVPVAGVYCTLCGTMILYETTHAGVAHELGTSGFLFRSNKLMYDRATQSLWNTIWGKPVIGPLARDGFQLKRRPIVTTTWGEWRRRHPETRVLSSETGHRRDYSEGAAYREYFSSDRLLFEVPRLDGRMKNKAEILALTFRAEPGLSLAIAADYLHEHQLYQSKLGSVSFVVVTDASGANRVYDAAGVNFVSWDGDRRLVEDGGREWLLSEAELRPSAGQPLRRLPAHRAFWFAWFAAHPETALVQ